MRFASTSVSIFAHDMLPLRSTRINQCQCKRRTLINDNNAVSPFHDVAQIWLHELRCEHVTKCVIFFVGNQLAFLRLVIQFLIDAFLSLKKCTCQMRSRQTKMLAGSGDVVSNGSPCASMPNSRNANTKKHFLADQCSTC